MRYTYQTKGTCSRQIVIELDGDVIRSVQFIGGCNGNTKGISSLVTGMKAGDVIRRCEGITCGPRPLTIQPSSRLNGRRHPLHSARQSLKRAIPPPHTFQPKKRIAFRPLCRPDCNPFHFIHYL